jgi:hypothetical protein
VTANTGHDELKFAVYRSNKTTRFEKDADSVTMTNGQITIAVGPKELVTLRGAKGAQLTVLSRDVANSRENRVPAVQHNAIVVPLGRRGTHTIELLDARGREVVARRVVTGDRAGSCRIPTGSLGAGVYLMRILGQDMHPRTYRMAIR